MPWTQSELEDIQGEEFASDVPIDAARMADWTEDEVRTYFSSGGAQDPGAAGQPVLSVAGGLHALSATLIDGSTLPMSTMLGKPVLMMNVASR